MSDCEQELSRARTGMRPLLPPVNAGGAYMWLAWILVFGFILSLAAIGTFYAHWVTIVLETIGLPVLMLVIIGILYLAIRKRPHHPATGSG